MLTHKKCVEGWNMDAWIPNTKEKTKMVDKVRCVIILCLNDKVWMEVAKKKTATLIWTKVWFIVYDQVFVSQTLSKQ